VLLLLTLNFTACKKLDHDEGFTSIGEVYIDASGAPALYDGLKVNYNGVPVDIQPYSGTTYRVRVPEGESTFQFYNGETSGDILAEKTVNIVPGSPETLLLFQPTETSDVAILDPNEQDNEEAAPEGFLKIKIANYANTALPLDKYDIVVEGDDGLNGWQELDVIKGVGTNLEGETYHLVAKGAQMYSYRFTYRIPSTGEFVLNGRGTVYTSGGVWEYPNPKPQKDVFTFFLSESKDRELEGATNAQKGRGTVVDGWIYSITPNILFAD